MGKEDIKLFLKKKKKLFLLVDDMIIYIDYSKE